MTYGGQGHPGQQPGWRPAQPGGQQPWPGQPQGQYQVGPFTPPLPQPPLPEPPLTLPGWGAIPALLGAILAAVGLLALPWFGEVTFFDFSESMGAASATELTGEQRWLDLYFSPGGFIALALAVIAPSMWALGTLRDRDSVRRRGGLTRKSLGEGRTGPTRALIAVLAGLCLLYHVISLLVLTDSGEHLDELAAGPWLVVAGTALSVVGAVIGPRVPPRPGWGQPPAR
ncbi:hypothetical protein [Actinophytocola gossypii]|uniref:DUF1648 domain-containing protein n=1 Tax=Actinophytocola gossypii TaxID=2812003 RepID=A0ABT2J216_9PSEU|nr:hypothetical protein [Actinophytocola gossypii]MCT2581895.1 hypothetical protein [Actinophytocola gossypii]